MDNGLTFADLVNRWVYTRYGLQKLRKRDVDFPKPVRVRLHNRGNLWRLEDIEVYEKIRPELTDEKVKKRKVASFAYCVMKGR